jgi:hypothetical protein
MSFLDDMLKLVDKETLESEWDQSMKDIQKFIRTFVPKSFFDWDKANPEQIQILLEVQNGERNIIIRAPRKGGKTILVAVLVVWLALRKDHYRIFVLAGSLEQAKWLYRYCRDIVTGHPKIRAQLLTEPTQTLTEFKNGSFIICSPASSKQVNAPTVDCLIMDEYVLIPSEIVTEAWPMIRASTEPRRFILSTAQQKISLDTFMDICDRAEELGFKFHFWDDTNCPWLSKSDDKIAKEILNAEDYNIQYKGGTPSKQGSIFPLYIMREAFIKPQKLLEGNPDYFKEIRGEIKVGIDWGFGHDTVMSAGWVSPEFKLHVFRIFITHKTDDEELVKIALSWDQEFYEKFGQRVAEWICDAAGAFQNALMMKYGLWVVKRSFGQEERGKEWMIKILNWFYEKKRIVIVHDDNGDVLFKQSKSYRRDRNGKPVKGFDHCIDSLLCLASGWNPLEAIEAPKEPSMSARRIFEKPISAMNWESTNPPDDMWRPDTWRKGDDKWPWEKG